MYDKVMANPLVLLVLLVLFAFVDAWYFVRSIYFALKAKSQRFLKTNFGVGRGHSLDDLLRPFVLHGMVLPSDIDLHMHMNNSKYLREMDFGRVQLYLQSGIREESTKLGAATLVAAITIRYRKSLQLWERFSLTTKVVHWNEDAFYLEQRFIGREGFTYAIAMVKMVARSKSRRVSPAEIIHKLVMKEERVESPPLTLELKCWIESMEKSSESLKKEQVSISQKQD